MYGARRGSIRLEGVGTDARATRSRMNWQPIRCKASSTVATRHQLLFGCLPRRFVHLLSVLSSSSSSRKNRYFNQIATKKQHAKMCIYSYSVILPALPLPSPYASKMSGFRGFGRRSSLGKRLFSTSHFFKHCGS